MALTKTRAAMITFLRHNYSLSYGTVADARLQRSLENALRKMRERDWNCLRGTVPLSSVAPHSTGTVTISDPDSDELTFSATLPADVAGQFIEFAGNKGWYKIKSRDSNTTATLMRTYIGDEALATAITYRIVYPLINLPANFRRMGDIWEIEPWSPLVQVEVGEAWFAQAWYGSGSQPLTYAIPQGHQDPNTMQMLMYPAPDRVRGYELFYVRDPGWFDNSDPLAAAWKREATLDTDYLDWPDRHMDLFYRAALVSLFEEDDPGNKLGFAMSSFNMLYEQVKADDSRWADTGRMGGKRRVQGIDVRLSGASPL